MQSSWGQIVHDHRVKKINNSKFRWSCRESSNIFLTSALQHQYHQSVLQSSFYNDLICHLTKCSKISVLFSNKMQSKFRTYFRTKCKFRSYFRKKCKFRSYFRKKCKFRTFCQWQMRSLLAWKLCPGESFTLSFFMSEQLWN